MENQKTHQIIALTGAQGVGKDSFWYLFNTALMEKARRKYNSSADIPYSRKSFAEPIWGMVAAVANKSVRDVSSFETKNNAVELFSCYAVGDNYFSFKREAQEFFNEYKSHFDEVEDVETSYRDLAEFIGEHFKDWFGESFWVKYLLSNLRREDKVVITDLRFEKEYEALKELNATFIRIVRIDENGKKVENNQYFMKKVPDEEMDYVLYNRGDEKAFKSAIVEMIEKLKIEI